ncbi:MAG: lipopolysaccharide biosynthesis protein [Granulosicoccus sp.]
MITTRFNWNVLTNSGMSVVNGVLQVLLIMAVGRLADEAFFASFLIAMALVAISEHGSDFGARVWGMQSFATAVHPYKVFWTSVKVKGFFSAILLCLLLVLPIPTLSQLQVFICFLIAITQPSADPLLWYLRGTARLDTDALVLVLWKASSVGVMASILLLEGGFNMMLLGWLSVNVLRLVAVFILLMPRLFQGSTEVAVESSAAEPPVPEEISVIAPPHKHWSVVRQTLPTGASFILMALNQRILLFALGFMAISADVSLFGAAHTLVSQAGFLAISLALAYLPSLARAQETAAASGDNTNMQRLLKLKFTRISMLIGLFCVMGIAGSPILSTVIYGQQFPMAGQLMIVLWPGLFLWSMTVAMRYVLVLRKLAWIDLIGSACGLMSSLFFLWLGTLALDADKTLVWVAALAWILGLLVEALIKTIALMSKFLLPVVTGFYIALWFIGLSGIAFATSLLI